MAERTSKSLYQPKSFLVTSGTKKDFGWYKDFDEYDNYIDKPYMKMMMDMECNSYTTRRKFNTRTMINSSMLKYS